MGQSLGAGLIFLEFFMLPVVFFYDDVKIDGPSSGSIAFTVKDRVDVRFLQTLDMFVETETWFRENVNIKEKECSSSGKGGCSHPPTIPELCVSGDIIALSDIIVENGEILVDVIRPFYPSTVVNVQGALTATGDITSLTGVVSPTDPVTASDIAALDLTGVGLHINSLYVNQTVTASRFNAFETIEAGGDISTSAGSFLAAGVPLPTSGGGSGASSPLTAADFAGSDLSSVSLTVASITAGSITSGGDPVLTSVSASDLEGLALTNIASLQVDGDIDITGAYSVNGVPLTVP